MGDVTRLLEHARRGEPRAWDEAVALLYEDLLRVAHRVHAGRGAATLDPVALVNECYLRVARRRAEPIADRKHFLAVAARAMRQILVNYARDRTAAKRGGRAPHVTLNEETLGADREAVELLALDEALGRLEAEDARLVRVVDCRVFCGLTEPETASALGLSLRTVQRLWREARRRLRLLLEG